MVTQFHTLLHFVTLNHTIFILSASVAASTSKQGVSKSHLLSIYVCKRICLHDVQAIAAGPRRISALQETPHAYYSPQDSYCMGMLAQ